MYQRKLAEGEQLLKTAISEQSEAVQLPHDAGASLFADGPARRYARGVAAGESPTRRNSERRTWSWAISTCGSATAKRAIREYKEGIEKDPKKKIDVREEHHRGLHAAGTAR